MKASTVQLLKRHGFSLQTDYNSLHNIYCKTTCIGTIIVTVWILHVDIYVLGFDYSNMWFSNLNYSDPKYLWYIKKLLEHQHDFSLVGRFQGRHLHG